MRRTRELGARGVREADGETTASDATTARGEVDDGANVPVELDLYLLDLDVNVALEVEWYLLELDSNFFLLDDGNVAREEVVVVQRSCKPERQDEW